jgi:uncharacterized protein YndB with AHSA1/START domain
MLAPPRNEEVTVLAITNVCELPIPPEYVWPFYTEPDEWPKWSADIEHASIGGEMGPGARGRCKYRMLPEGTFTVTEWNRPHSFTLDWETLGTHVIFEHRLVPMGEHGSHIEERIDFQGWLSPLLGLAERPRIRTDWPRAMDCLAWLALATYPHKPHGRQPDRPRTSALSSRRSSHARMHVTAEPLIETYS